jgi:hypothetical protein
MRSDSGPNSPLRGVNKRSNITLAFYNPDDCHNRNDCDSADNARF